MRKANKLQGEVEILREANSNANGHVAELSSQLAAAYEQRAELLFVLEAALPFLKSHIGNRLCSSNASPEAVESILRKYDWQNERRKWIYK